MAVLHDAHCHLASAEWFEENEAALIKMQHDGKKLICMSCDIDEWSFLSQLTLKYHRLIIPAFGIHPWKAHLYKKIDEQHILTNLSCMLQRHPNMVIGEVGLDFHPNRIPEGYSSESEINSWQQIQCNILQIFLNFAKQHNLSVSLHCVKAFDTMKKFDIWDGGLKLAFHSFSGNTTIGKEFMHCAYFSFSLLLNSKSLRRGLVECLPIEKILVETDLPFCKMKGNELQEIFELVNKFKPEFNEEQASLNFQAFISNCF